MTKQVQQVKKVLEAAGFEVAKNGEVFEIVKPGLVNPADVRSAVSALLSSEGFNGYYLKEVYAFKASRKPWRTEEEGYVEFLAWEDFTRVEQQKEVAKLNRVQVGDGVKVTPLTSGSAP